MHPIHSLDPDTSSVVFSSAGSGKTWLLIARILRLLLAQAAPRSILAITFTRKAVGEMRERLDSKLKSWAFMDDPGLREELKSIGYSSIGSTVLKSARDLYERVALQDNRVYITTFHAFCHDIQRMFPLESHLPIGFQLTEHTTELFHESIEQLYLRAEHSDTQLAQALDILFAFTDGPSGAQIALKNFWELRTEWQLFSHDQADRAAHAEFCLEQLYATLPQNQPLTHPDSLALMREYSSFLSLSGTPSHQNYVSAIQQFVERPSEHYANIRAFFLYKDRLETKPLKISKKWVSKIGDTHINRLQDLHASIAESMIQTEEKPLRDRLIQANRAWWYAGNALLECYKKVKNMRGLVDFEDLEYETFRLMQQHDYAHWLHYKLGSQIKHFLVDEFQDTNTLQWKLLQPLIRSATEISDSSANSSVFMVGDIKQSIYRFRRANPAIMNSAYEWCNQHLKCNRYTNNISWRSGPYIIDFVNRAFSSMPLQNKLQDFSTHQCQQQHLWSRVEIYPLIPSRPPADIEYMRNPLESPRSGFLRSGHYAEGSFIAQRINELIDAGLVIEENGNRRRINFSDILILTRNRSHVGEIEIALRDQAIPFSSNEAGLWLQRLEIRDIRALLTILNNPYDELALVQVLRSPLFDICNEDLMALRSTCEQNLYHCIALQTNEKNALYAAFEKISEWRNLCDRIPIHDLLDKIYFEWNVIERYRLAIDSCDQSLVEDYLLRFLALTLQIESGRYPNMGDFILALDSLESELADQSTESSSQRVRLLTIHGAKGLESPIVFLADTGPNQKPSSRLQAMVDWPSHESAPTLFALSTKEVDLDRATRAFKHRLDMPIAEEQYNLLYVALTRARQLLIVTGTRGLRTGSNSWHDMLCQSLGCEITDTPWTLGDNIQSTSGVTSPTASHKPVCMDELEWPSRSPSFELQQSAGTSDTASEDATARAGIIVHKCLEILSDNAQTSPQNVINRLLIDTGTSITLDELSPAFNEALGCIQNPECRAVFDTDQYIDVHNEVPVMDCINNKQVMNVIDRLLIHTDFVWIVDYKSNQIHNNEDINRLTEEYAAQMSRYKDIIGAMYLKKEIRCSILFTKLPRLVDL